MSLVFTVKKTQKAIFIVINKSTAKSLVSNGSLIMKEKILSEQSIAHKKRNIVNREGTG